MGRPLTKEPTGEAVSLPETAPVLPDRLLRPRRIVWILAILVLLGVGIALAAIDGDRFYRIGRAPVWSLPACWTAAFALLVGFAPALARNRKPLWVTAAVLLGLLTLPLWLLAVLASSLSTDELNVIEAVHPSPDGRVHAVTETFYNVIDPSCRVWLREPGGLFARQVLVWERIEANCPQRVWFPDDTTISIDYGTKNQPFTTTFDPDNMRVTETSARPQ